MGNKGSTSLRDTNHLGFGPHGTYKTVGIGKEQARPNSFASSTSEEQIVNLERTPEGILLPQDYNIVEHKETDSTQKSVKEDRSESVNSEVIIIGSHLL
uniref:Uncharacterized protein n=1 Tax=Acrobeloides nanus TaxID=290746 RepID=A0A914DWU0_9BILA